jgi:hypothetical protein
MLLVSVVVTAFASAFAENGNGAPAIDSSEEIVVYAPQPSSHAREAPEAARARAYLVATATPGYTMTRQGPERAIGRLHPVFADRLAAAIAEARASGLTQAGVFSAYRPPVFGVGGFADKFHSLHTYGLAVDVAGIGAAGTPSALLWHEIATRHGLICPYGPHNAAEWNHCQPTRVRIILAENPLRETVTADGPISLEDMFEVGNSIIEAADSAIRPTAHSPAHALEPPQGRPAAPVKPRVAATANNVKAARDRRALRTDPVVLEAKRRLRLTGGRLGGWPKSVPSIINLDHEPRSAKSRATRTSSAKPITIPQIVAGYNAGRK